MCCPFFYSTRAANILPLSNRRPERKRTKAYRLVDHANKRALIKVYAGVEPNPMSREENLMVPNKGRCRCLDSHFRRPRVDFSASMRWNGP